MCVKIVNAFVIAVAITASIAEYTEEDARKYLQVVNDMFAEKNHDSTVAEWNYETNISNVTLEEKLEASAKLAKFTKSQWAETLKYPWKTYTDSDIKRQFKKFSVLGTPALPEEKFERLEKIVAEMQAIYSTTKICSLKDREKCDMSLEPDLDKIMATSREVDNLKHVWTEWRKQIGAKIRPLYREYVLLTNNAATLNNFTDAAEYWLDSYDTEDFREQLASIWEQVRPLYMQLHAYVRGKLLKVYGDGVVSKRGPIPAHLLGNMWGQSWSNIAELTLPYPNAKYEDVTPNLVQQKYDAERMFRQAEDFFTSINLTAMPDTFWERSIITKPKDRDFVCHASAWDFYDAKDFRIKQCTEINAEYFKTIHHEMGHIQYFLQYRYLPFIYRDGANPGFHEAIGDVIALSSTTLKHLNKIGLLRNVSNNRETDLNKLFKVAMEKIAFLPYGYIMDLWRWNVFKGKISEDDYNCEWWRLRNEYQGLEPPNQRTEEDFDIAAKYHIVAGVPYIRYFVSYIIQFQFHEALCIKAGEYDPKFPEEKPLHECDIYNSVEAGNVLGRMLQMGSSKPWPDAMEVITGQRKLDARPLLEYFSPIHEWLKEENNKNKEYIGWGEAKKGCEKNVTLSNMFQTVVEKIMKFFKIEKL